MSQHYYCDRLNHFCLGHVQKAHRVAVTVQKGSHCVQGFVELPLNIRQLLKHFAGRPEQNLQGRCKWKLLFKPPCCCTRQNKEILLIISPVPFQFHSCASSSGETLEEQDWRSLNTCQVPKNKQADFRKQLTFTVKLGR